ncbi:MAG: fimbrillin family protein [Bacteroidaceae bacterium]|nr:fimbrillin family protein [Bacteroidaceae bacterium]
MKKSYLMIAAAAALFAACAEKDTFKDVDNQEVAIGFNAITENVTKAAITGVTGTNSLATEGGFVVYGYKTLNSWQAIAQTVFDEKNVYYENNDWIYQGLRFWDKNGKYNFYAVAPYQPTDQATYSINSTLGNSFGYITITGAKSNKYSASDDYLLARAGAKDVLGSAHTGASNPDVPFSFNHVMAKVEFALKSTLASGTVTVTALKMTGWNNDEATFVQASASTPSGIECTEWTLDNTPVAGDIDLVGANTGNTQVVLTCSATNAQATTLADWYIMVPQTITYTAPAANVTEAGLTFTVTYTYNDGAATNPYIETFTDQVAIVPSDQTWGTDSHTKYTLDIKPNVINFDVTTIAGFTNDGGLQDDVTVH